jgi:hypothetical protein
MWGTNLHIDADHAAVVALYVAHCNLCRYHEAIRSTPGKPLGLPITLGRLANFWTPPSDCYAGPKLPRIGGAASV